MEVRGKDYIEDTERRLVSKSAFNAYVKSPLWKLATKTPAPKRVRSALKRVRLKYMSIAQTPESDRNHDYRNVFERPVMDDIYLVSDETNLSECMEFFCICKKNQ